MAFQVSPGIQVKEIDLSSVVPAVSSTRGAFAGVFQWGPVDEVKTVSDSQELVDEFYQPANTDAGSEDFYSAESFLRYGSSLSVVRINTTGLFSANASGNSSSLLKNADDYVNTYQGGAQAGTVGKFVSRYAGALGNSIKVSVCASSNAYFNDNVNLINSGSGHAVGSTTVAVDAGNAYLVRDIIKFQNHSTLYRVTNISTNTLTIEAIGEPAGTGLTTAVVDNEQVDRHWEHFQLFDKLPGTSANASSIGASNDEIHIVVQDEDGLITGTKNEVLETFGFVSLASDAKDSVGNSNYYKDVIQQKSNYIYWSGHSTAMLSSATENRTLNASISSAFSRPALPENSSLSGGADGRQPTVAQKTLAWDTHFKDNELFNASFLIVGSTRTDNGSGTQQDILADHNSLVNQAIVIAESRKDMLVVASPRRASVVGVSSESTQSSNVIADFASVTSSSYLVIDSGWVYQY